MRLFTTILLITISIFSLKAQKITLENNTIEQQFETIYKKSSNYQVYKVIKKLKYKELQKNVADSIFALKQTISQKNKQLDINFLKIKEVENDLTKIKSDLNLSNQKENSISFFGIVLSKLTYNLILWSIIIALITGLSYFIYKFFRSNQITKQAKKELVEVEMELEIHRKKSLEREQKLRRKLQDEINKQRNV